MNFGSGGSPNVNTPNEFANYATDASGVLDDSMADIIGLNDFSFNNQGLSMGGEGGGILDFLGGDSFMGLAGGAMDLFGAISQYGMMKDQLGMQQDQLDFSKDAFNRNSSNQAQLINSKQADQLASRLAYGTDQMDADRLGGQTQEEYLSKRAVDGSPIK